MQKVGSAVYGPPPGGQQGPGEGGDATEGEFREV